MNKKQVRDYAKIHIMSIFVLCIIAIGFGSSACDDPSQICFEIDGADCPGAISSGAALALQYTSYMTQYQGVHWEPGNPLHGQYRYSSFPFPGGIPVEVVQHSERGFGTAGGNATESYVEGWEINYGWWSRDSYRRYSYRELFEWKNERPWTPADGPITDQQARDWFNERHRVWREPIIGSNYWDYPRDVRTFNAPLSSICFNAQNAPSGQSRHSFNGEIHFPNGVRCAIDPNPTEFRESFGSDGSPHKKKLKIRKPCAGC